MRAGILVCFPFLPSSILRNLLGTISFDFLKKEIFAEKDGWISLIIEIE